MNPEERLKIQKNYSYLLDELHTDDVADNLFSNFVISHDNLQRVHSKKTDKDKARCLIDILLRTENSFGPFLKEIEFSRPDLAKKIMMTDVSEELYKESCGENTDRSSEILTAMAQSTEASTSRGGHNLRLRKSLKDITNYNDHIERKDVCLQVKSKHLDTKYNKFLEFNEEDGAPIKKRKTEPSPILLNELKDPGQRVTVSAKVLSLLQEPEEMEIYGTKKTTKSEFLIADHTKGVVLTVWEDDFDKIKTGESYIFGNLSTRHYKKMVKLTTTPDTTITLVAHLQSLEESENIGKIVGAFVEIDKKCKTCLKVIAQSNLGEPVTKCLKCNRKHRTELLLDDIQADIRFQFEKSEIKLTILKGPLRRFLTNNNQTDLLQTAGDLEDFLINLPAVKLQYLSENVTLIERHEILSF